MNEHCSLYGHYWGHGPVSGVFVCMRKRCTAQAVCQVCVSGFVPAGFLLMTCAAHTPAAAVPEPKKRSRRVSSSQDSLW